MTCWFRRFCPRIKSKLIFPVQMYELFGAQAVWLPRAILCKEYQCFWALRRQLLQTYKRHPTSSGIVLSCDFSHHRWRQHCPAADADAVNTQLRRPQNRSQSTCPIMTFSVTLATFSLDLENDPVMLTRPHMSRPRPRPKPQPSRPKPRPRPWLSRPKPRPQPQRPRPRPRPEICGLKPRPRPNITEMTLRMTLKIAGDHDLYRDWFCTIFSWPSSWPRLRVWPWPWPWAWPWLVRGGRGGILKDFLRRCTLWSHYTAGTSSDGRIEISSDGQMEIVGIKRGRSRRAVRIDEYSTIIEYTVFARKKLGRNKIKKKKKKA